MKKELTAQEQFDRINIALNQLESLKTKLLQDCIFCTKCNKYYYKKETNISSRSTQKLICTNPFDGYLESYNYEEIIVQEFCRICPEKHQIGKYSENLSDLL